MATTKNVFPQSTKLTAAEAKELVVKLTDELKILKEDSASCNLCSITKKKEKFYISTDPRCKSGITSVCKECARKIALRVDKNGEEHQPTKESCQLALRYLNKPFLNTIWNASIQESDNLTAGRVKHNVWTSYIKNIQMVQHNGLTYFDSDFFKEKLVYGDEKVVSETLNKMSEDAMEDFQKNKNDTIRLLGYDPFDGESVTDQPFLYSQLLGLLDTGGDENDDMMRNASCTIIVRGFLQSTKIDNTISNLMSDIANVEKNSGIIKTLQDSKQKLTSMITNLAAESCISLKNNKNAKKGENTWTGKIKKIKELDLRQGRVNGFDIETCKAMRQVMDMSHHSIINELKLDDSDWSDMVAQQKQIISELQHSLDQHMEISRILLSENLDLKTFIKNSNVPIDGYSFVDIENIYSNIDVVDDVDSGDSDEE